MSVEKTPERAAAGFDPSLAQFCNRFDQGQVRPLGDQIKISTANSSNGETLPPRGFGAALLC